MVQLRETLLHTELPTSSHPLTFTAPSEAWKLLKVSKGGETAGLWYMGLFFFHSQPSGGNI